MKRNAATTVAIRASDRTRSVLATGALVAPADPER